MHCMIPFIERSKPSKTYEGSEVSRLVPFEGEVGGSEHKGASEAMIMFYFWIYAHL